ncbi:hypothetical protein Acsp02_72880 [Actinoplanes sp. NBRC 103695]|nr:hypothetical protein Acsp02_72880 [Actinoplanes sp. NBRC 103695]
MTTIGGTAIAGRCAAASCRAATIRAASARTEGSEADRRRWCSSKARKAAPLRTAASRECDGEQLRHGFLRLQGLVVSCQFWVAILGGAEGAAQWWDVGEVDVGDGGAT